MKAIAAISMIGASGLAWADPCDSVGKVAKAANPVLAEVSVSRSAKDVPGGVALCVLDVKVLVTMDGKLVAVQPPPPSQQARPINQDLPDGMKAVAKTTNGTDPRPITPAELSAQPAAPAQAPVNSNWPGSNSALSR